MMMRRVGLPPFNRCWVPMGVTARTLSTKQCYKPPNAAGTGRVIAPESMIEIVKAMDSKDARLLRGVPYMENVEAKQLLSRHCQDKPEKVADRYSLVCNSGPPGVGKTMLLCQNMLQAAHNGYLSVFIDFNGDQSSPKEERQLGFNPRIALRIEWYLSEKETSFSCYSRRELAKRGSEEMTIEDAVQKLKEHADHTCPVFLAVDELKVSAKSAPHEQEELEDHLTLWCEVMDWSIGRAKNDARDERIHVAVSVNNAVSLVHLTAESGRNLLHQPTLPVFPLWVARDSVDDAAISKLPLAMRMFFDNDARNSLYAAGRPLGEDCGRDVIHVKEFIAILGDLVLASAGHGRRVEALFREVAKLPPSVQSCEKGTMKIECEALATHLRCSGEVDLHLRKGYSTGPAMDLVRWKSEVKTAMNQAFDLHDTETQLMKAASETKDLALFLVHLLEGLFNPDYIETRFEDTRASHMLLASLHHYALLGEGQKSIGYLPTETIRGLCQQYGKLPKPRDVFTKRNPDAVVQFVSEAAAQCAELASPQGARERDPKAFARCMMHTMCAALLSGRKLSEMLRTPRPILKHEEIDISLSNIEVLQDVVSFPSHIDGGESKASIDANLMNKIKGVGGDDNLDRGLAFEPAHLRDHLCCDFVIVLPLWSGYLRPGVVREHLRVVLLVLCNDSFTDTVDGAYAFDHFRWNQQFAQEKSATAGSAALQKILAQEGTVVRHVLLTVNEAPREGRLMKNTLSSEQWKLPNSSTIDYTDGFLRDDEWLMDLDHMRSWCPSVAYAALIGLQVRDLLADPAGIPAAEEKQD